jgi:hypothetical protein
VGQHRCCRGQPVRHALTGSTLEVILR